MFSVTWFEVWTTPLGFVGFMLAAAALYGVLYAVVHWRGR